MSVSSTVASNAGGGNGETSIKVIMFSGKRDE
jgi:hypothetical protein